MLFQIVAGAFLFAPTQEARADNVYFSDNFTGGSIDISKWTKVDSSAGGTNVVQNNVLSVIGNNAWGTNGLKSVNTFDRSSKNLIIETDMAIGNCSIMAGGFGYGEMMFPSTTGTYLVFYSSGVLKLMYSNTVGGVTVPTSFSCTNNVPFHVKLVVLQTGGAQLYVNNSVSPDAILKQGGFSDEHAYLASWSSSGITYDNFIAYATPGSPTNLQAIQGDEQVILNWTAPDDGGFNITDYFVEYKETGSQTFLTFPDGVSINTSATVTGLAIGKYYDFRVSAANINGTGTASDILNTLAVVLVSSIPMATSVNIIGSNAVGETLAGRYAFVDLNGDSEGFPFSDG